MLSQSFKDFGTSMFTNAAFQTPVHSQEHTAEEGKSRTLPC